MTCLSRYAHWYNNSKNILGATSYFLIGVKTFSTGQNSCPILLSNKDPIIRQDKVSRGKYTTKSQINGHCVKLTPIDECLFQASSERPFEVHGDECKDPQLTKMQRVSESRILSLK